MEIHATRERITFCRTPTRPECSGESGKSRFVLQNKACADPHLPRTTGIRPALINRRTRMSVKAFRFRIHGFVGRRGNSLRRDG